VTAVTGVTLVAVLVVIVPVGYVLYRRRADLFEVLRRIPDSVTVALGGFEYVVETAQLLTAVESTLRRLAVEVARALPVLTLKLVVFVLLIYGLLYRPTAVREAVDRLVPRQYHDVVQALHDRTWSTLYAIYVLQAATAVGTFFVALVVFAALGYQSALALAVAAGLLQFVPVVGPSVVVVLLAAGDLLVGATGRALAVLVLGLVLVGFLPGRHPDETGGVDRRPPGESLLRRIRGQRPHPRADRVHRRATARRTARRESRVAVGGTHRGAHTVLTDSPAGAGRHGCRG
jgi:predicted PurR-regulated permease PerM